MTLFELKKVIKLILKNHRKNITIEVLFFIYITFVYVASDDFFFLDRLLSIGGGHLSIFGHFSRFLFIFEYFLAITVLIYSTRLANKLLANTLITALCFFIFLDLAAFYVYGRPADIFNIAMLNAAVANTKDALFEHSGSIFKAIFFTVLIYVPLVLHSSFNTYKGNTIVQKIALLSLFIGMITIYASTLIVKGVPALIGFPKGFSYVFASLSIELNSLISPLNYREINRLTDRVINDKLNNIIVVMDESVEYSNFVEAKKQWQQENGALLGGGLFVDFGLTFSSANCSAPSNYVVRKATWEVDGERLLMFQVPSLFEIARQQGYQITYIDNQHVLKDPTVRNYIDNKEASLINEIYSPMQPEYVRDLASIEFINGVLKNSSKNFIFVNKVGAHFPYEKTINPQYRTSSRLTDYSISLQQNSVLFLDKLSKSLTADTVLFYTSDHGQNFSSGATHCNTGKDISPKEYFVPFVVGTGNLELLAHLKENQSLFEKNRKYLTHLHFSESIRNLLGVEIKNKSSIFKINLVLKEQTNSYCGLYGQPMSFLGRNPSCYPIKIR